MTAKKTFELIVPPMLETHLTGRFGAMQQTWRGAIYAVQFTREHMILVTKCTKEGAEIAWADLPKSVRRDAHAAWNIIAAAWQMAPVAT